MKKKWIGTTVGIVLLAAVLVALFTLLLPWLQARSTAAPRGGLTIQEQTDGSLQVSWEPVPGADFYLLEIMDAKAPASEDTAPLYRQRIEGYTGMQLPALDPSATLTLRVTPGKDYAIYGQVRQRYSESYLEVTTTFDAPAVQYLTSTPDPEHDVLSAAYTMKKGDRCIVSRLEADGSLTELCQVEEEQWKLTFGEGKDVPMPAWNEKVTFVLSAERQVTGLLFKSRESGRITITGEDLLDRNLAPVLEDLSDNLYRITWRETKGEAYEIQRRNSGEEDWVPVAWFSRGEDRIYETEQLEPFRHYEYRVLAVGGQTMEGSPYAAESAAMAVDTDCTALYCTIWPTKDLEGYSDPEKGSVVTNVVTGKAYTVLAEDQGMFCVRTDQGRVYIDSRYCMINLPEYLGELCAYRITNSYSSKYLVHEYEMPRVSGTEIVGYENIRLADKSYLVPLLYPTAQMLRNAGLAAQEAGYRLKIYDAYRPNVATVRLYDRMVGILDNVIPERTYTGKKVTLVEVEDPAMLTYRLVMTNDQWAINNFLARGYSKHNQGVAVDLTLETLEEGEEVDMQTSMHDLSWYSSRTRNNKNAKKLSEFMTGAGFGTLKSEWWHYQDNGSRETLDLAVVKEGFHCEGWVADEFGWRYRQKDGSFLAECTQTIEETAYTFDELGYVQLEEGTDP